MSGALWVIISVAWYVTGVGGFIYWWAKDFDFAVSEIGPCIFIGLLGPFSWVIGLGMRDSGRAIIKKRTQHAKK